MLARVTKKPLLWIFGQIIDYMIRLRPDMVPEMMARKARGLDSAIEMDGRKDLSMRKGVTIGVHIRGRNPDAGRKVRSDCYCHC
jgi:hypothetical protein